MAQPASRRPARACWRSWLPWTSRTQPRSPATNDTGRLRYNGRKELAAIAALDEDVTDESRWSRARPRCWTRSAAPRSSRGDNARRAAQLLSGVVEQLLIDSKRARDTEAAAMNMQLVTWRDQAGGERGVRGGRRVTPCAPGGNPNEPEDTSMPPDIPQPHPDDSAGHHRPADDLRAAVHPVRVWPVRRVRRPS